MAKKILIGTAIVIFVGVLFVFRNRVTTVLNFTETPTPSTDLGPKTVSDEIYFSIDIPAQWIVEQRLSQKGAILSTLVVGTKDFSVASSKSAETPFAPIFVRTGANLVAQVVPSTADGTHQSGVEREEKIQIAGEDALLHIFKDATLAEGQYIDVHVPHAGRIYILRMSYNSTTYSNGEAIFREIISTLAFKK